MSLNWDKHVFGDQFALKSDGQMYNSSFLRRKSFDSKGNREVGV